MISGVEDNELVGKSEKSGSRKETIHGFEFILIIQHKLYSVLFN